LKEKTKCCFAGWHKNCDQKIKQKGMPGGRAKKTGEVLINAFKIKLFHLLKRLGFLPWCKGGL